MIENQRHRFAMPSDVHYLNCAYMSPLTDTVRAAMASGISAKAQPWHYQPADFFSVAEDFRTSAAQLFGAGAGDIAPGSITPNNIAIVPSVSYAMAIAAKNLPLAG